MKPSQVKQGWLRWLYLQVVWLVSWLVVTLFSIANSFLANFLAIVVLVVAQLKPSQVKLSWLRWPYLWSGCWLLLLVVGWLVGCHKICHKTCPYIQNKDDLCVLCSNSSKQFKTVQNSSKQFKTVQNSSIM